MYETKKGDYDAMFVIGIKDNDISFEIESVDNKFTSIIYMLDDENEKIPDKLLYTVEGIPLPRKPILYQQLSLEQIKEFNWNPLLEPYNNIYLRIVKLEHRIIVGKFTEKEWSKISMIDLDGILINMRLD